jgi:hypothetical protein
MPHTHVCVCVCMSTCVRAHGPQDTSQASHTRCVCHPVCFTRCVGCEVLPQVPGASRQVEGLEGQTGVRDSRDRFMCVRGGWWVDQACCSRWVYCCVLLGGEGRPA